LRSGGKCQVTSNEDFKVEYLSQNLNVTYDKYQYNELKVCTAVETGKYISGKNLLFDFDKICGYMIVIENTGPVGQKFTIYLKNALFGFRLSNILMIGILSV